MEQDTGSKLYDISEEELVMEGPIISIDVSNGNSHYILFEKNDKKVGGVHKINHDV